MNDYQQLKEILGTLPGLRMAILFGSLARGAATQDSDLDLAVDLGAPLTVDQKMELISSLAATTGRPVDLIDLRTVGEPLLATILQQGIRLIGSDTDYGKLLSKHLLDDADFMPYYRRLLKERRDAWIGS